jgi:ferredoxin
MRSSTGSGGRFAAMVTIDPSACTGCGTCVGICHEHCMSIADGALAIDHAVCSTCAQCVAVCPRRALAWDGVPPRPFDPARLPSPDQMDELFKERRTVRRFRQEPVPRQLLERIAAYAAYAPTHNHDFRLIILDDPALVDAVRASLSAFSRRLGGLFFRSPLVRAALPLVGPALRLEFIRTRAKLDAAAAAPPPPEARPAALLAVVGDTRTPLNLSSAQYVLYTVCLAAQARGVGSQNLVGSQGIVNRDKRLRARLGIRRGEAVFGLAGLGFPAVRFRNAVEGRAFPVQWNGE